MNTRPTRLPLFLLCIAFGNAHAYESRDMRLIDGIDSRTGLDFWSGFALFRDPWEVAGASTKGRDGLGPMFNARSCSACHRHAGPSAAARNGAVPFGVIVKLRGATLNGADQGRSNGTAYNSQQEAYGGQLQTYSVAPQKIAIEGSLAVSFIAVPATLVDKKNGDEKILLQQPVWRIERPGYGALAADTVLSLRIAPPLYGLGLIEAIPTAAIKALADPDDRDGDGISGVTGGGMEGGVARDGSDKLARFGWQAEQTTLTNQSALALWSDIGITSSHFRQQNCQPAQVACNAARSGANADGVEITDDKLALVTRFIRLLAPPASGKSDARKNLEGAALFASTGCAACHHDTFTTQSDIAALDKKSIAPYSDFLLHDMGDALNDKRIDGKPVATQWRTPPLWGLSLRVRQQNFGLLHDGRARSITEAILWHSGEANNARQGFSQMDKDSRQKLLQFLEQL